MNWNDIVWGPFRKKLTKEERAEKAHEDCIAEITGKKLVSVDEWLKNNPDEAL